jgi:UDP-N-acetyl-D-glucosamine dehydrogenase
MLTLLVRVELIERRGATTAFHDPHVARIPKLREHPNCFGRQGVALTQAVLSDFDAVLIATDHDDVDYVELSRMAKLVIDTRNACARAGVKSDNTVKAPTLLNPRDT